MEKYTKRINEYTILFPLDKEGDYTDAENYTFEELNEIYDKIENEFDSLKSKLDINKLKELEEEIFNFYHKYEMTPEMISDHNKSRYEKWISRSKIE